MAVALPNGEQDLTGVWHGQYAYPAELGPNAFVATLIETPGYLGGGIHETGDQGPALGKPLLAEVSGARQATRVTFTKTYVITAPYVAAAGYVWPVRYEGVLSADGEEVEGVWTIPGAWSGRFMMIRANVLRAVARERAEART